MKEEFAVTFREVEPKLRATLNPGESLEDKITAYFEPFQKAIETVEDVYKESLEINGMILNSYENLSQGKDVTNNVLPVDVGGHLLRRSVWKKITIWQYATTNLNLHLLINKLFPFAEVQSLTGDQDFSQSSSSSASSPHTSTSTVSTAAGGAGGGQSRNLHYIPTITLGCPAAHELKFSDGGLRKIFADIPTLEQKLNWIQAIQSPTMESLEKMISDYPKEAVSLFGSKCLNCVSNSSTTAASAAAINQSSSSSGKDDYATLMRKKADIARRIDICASQALGCGVMVVRTTLLLASLVGGIYFDILARSLKIGFLVMFESMLSTQGAELGMIEDLEIAALWLSLVTVRLVTKPMAVPGQASTNSQQSVAGSYGSESGGAPHRDSLTSVSIQKRNISVDGKPVFFGVGEGITARRDSVSLFVDVVHILYLVYP
jgi:hypothetical protein